MLDNNIYKNQQIPQFQAMSQTQSQNTQQQQAMQASNPELLKQNIQDSYVANRVSETTDDLKGMLYTAAIGVPAWAVATQAMDYYAKKSRGNYEDTLHHKVGQFGDDVTNYVKGSKFGKSSVGQGINSGFKSFKSFLKNNLIDRFAITRAFAYTPSKPELDMVKGQANGMWGMQIFDYPQHFFVPPQPGGRSPMGECNPLRAFVCNLHKVKLQNTPFLKEIGLQFCKSRHIICKVIVLEGLH